MMAGWGISCEIALIWMSLDFTYDQSTLFQVMVWSRQATSHWLSCWPRSLSPYDVTRPQWVNSKWGYCINNYVSSRKKEVQCRWSVFLLLLLLPHKLWIALSNSSNAWVILMQWYIAACAPVISLSGVWRAKRMTHLMLKLIWFTPHKRWSSCEIYHIAHVNGPLAPGTYGASFCYMMYPIFGHG